MTSPEAFTSFLHLQTLQQAKEGKDVWLGSGKLIQENFRTVCVHRDSTPVFAIEKQPHRNALHLHPEVKLMSSYSLIHLARLGQYLTGPCWKAGGRVKAAAATGGGPRGLVLGLGGAMYEVAPPPY